MRHTKKPPTLPWRGAQIKPGEHFQTSNQRFDFNPPPGYPAFHAAIARPHRARSDGEQKNKQ